MHAFVDEKGRRRRGEEGRRHYVLRSKGIRELSTVRTVFRYADVERVESVILSSFVVALIRYWLVGWRNGGGGGTGVTSAVHGWHVLAARVRTVVSRHYIVFIETK
uniref:Transmembrane protein n=1 Tax=Loa loa TaxID=7209 RepID=A0A1I7V5A8_LOALO